MKYTLKDGTIIEGTWDEIQTARKDIETETTTPTQTRQPPTKKEKTVTPKPTAQQIIRSVIGQIKEPLTLAIATRLLQKNGLKEIGEIGRRKVHELILREGFTVMNVRVGSKTSGNGVKTKNIIHVVMPPTNNATLAVTTAIPHAYGARKAKKGTGKYCINDAAIEQLVKHIGNEGYATTAQVHKIAKTAPNISNRQVMDHIKSDFPQCDIVLVKGKGLAMYHKVDELKAAHKSGKRGPHKTYMRVKSEYQQHLSKRVLELTKERGMRQQDAFRQAVNEWNAKKANRTPVTRNDANSTRDDDVSSRVKVNAVYADVLCTLSQRGVNHYTPEMLDAIGNTLRTTGKVGWNFRDFYLNEERWTDVVLPTLMMHNAALSKHWSIGFRFDGMERTLVKT